MSDSLKFNERVPLEDWKSDLRSDAASYYVYLPMAFKYGMRASNAPADVAERAGRGFKLDRQKDRIVTKCTYVVALLEAPFYAAAELCTNGRMDAFSRVHHRAVEVAGIFYWCLGLWLLGSALQRRFPIGPGAAVAVLLAISFGSNLFFYAFRMPGYSHVYSFFLVCLSIWSLLSAPSHGGPSWKMFAFHASNALIAIGRPIDIILVLGLYTWAFIERRDWYRSITYWAMGLSTFLVEAIPQMMYWRLVHGSWIVYSYGEEGFVNWRSPYVLEVLFSTNNGAMPYAPVLILLPIGLCSLWPRQRKLAVTIALMFVAITYACASWHSWEFGCSYGQRSMVQYLPFAAVSLWGLFATRNLILVKIRTTVMPVMALLCYMNYRAMLQYDPCFAGDIWEWRAYIQNILLAFFDGTFRFVPR